MERTGQALKKTLEERLSRAKIEGACKDSFLSKAEFFYVDDPVLWPLKESYFYLGHVPKLSNLLSQLLAGSNQIAGERTIHGVYYEWHKASVRLASRIFGEIQRRVTHSWDKERKGLVA
jgi:hypothetical protein